MYLSIKILGKNFKNIIGTSWHRDEYEQFQRSQRQADEIRRLLHLNTEERAEERRLANLAIYPFADERPIGNPINPPGYVRQSDRNQLPEVDPLIRNLFATDAPPIGNPGNPPEPDDIPVNYDFDRDDDIALANALRLHQQALQHLAYSLLFRNDYIQPLYVDDLNAARQRHDLANAFINPVRGSPGNPPRTFIFGFEFGRFMSLFTPNVRNMFTIFVGNNGQKNLVDFFRRHLPSDSNTIIGASVFLFVGACLGYFFIYTDDNNISQENTNDLQSPD